MNEANKDKTVKGISVGVKIDTTQLDEAIVKANQLVQLLERADALGYRISQGNFLKLIEDSFVKGSGTEKPAGVVEVFERG